MANPTFDILLSTDSVNSRVLCNGEDITHCVQAVSVTQDAGMLPVVTLRLTPGRNSASVRAQCEAILKIAARDTPDDPLHTTVAP